MPCKIHSPALISAHPDLQGLDRRFVCGFIGESELRIAASQFKGWFFSYIGESSADFVARFVKTNLGIRYENVCLCVWRGGCLVVMLRNSLLMLTSLNHSVVPACVSYHFRRIKTQASTMGGLMCWIEHLITISRGFCGLQIKRSPD